MALGEYIGAWPSVTWGLWRMNGNSNDASGNWRNGTATNITWQWGKLWSWSGNFDWTNSNVSLYAPTINTSDFTFITWFNTSTIPASAKAIVSNNNSWNYFSMLVRYTATNNIWFEIFASVITYTTTFSDWKWHMVAWVRRNNVQYLYYDWLLVWNANPWTNSAWSSTIVLWWRPLDTAQRFTWNIDESFYENYWWTDNQIKRYYTHAKWRFWIL